MSASKERLFVFAICFLLATAGLTGDGAASPLSALVIAAVFAIAITATIVIIDHRDRERR